MPDLVPRRTLSRSRLRPVRALLAALAVTEAVNDVRRERDPLRGPALPLGLAAGWCAIYDAGQRRPNLSFSRGLQPSSIGVVQVPSDGLWAVTVYNSGEAIARILALSYFAVRNGQTVESEEANDVRHVFDEFGHDERNYMLNRLTPGASIGPGASVTLFELPLAVANAFTSLGVRLTYAGPWGERTELTVECRPPHGYPKPADTPSEAPVPAVP